MANVFPHDPPSSRRMPARPRPEPPMGSPFMAHQSDDEPLGRGAPTCQRCATNDGFRLATSRCDESSPVRCGEIVLTARMLFTVSLDEEYVRLQLVAGARSFDMGARVHNYLLLILARQRLADNARGFAESASGWITTTDFEHDPSLAPPRVTLYVHRIRRQLDHLGFPRGLELIERQPRHRIRIAAHDLDIVRV